MFFALLLIGRALATSPAPISVSPPPTENVSPEPAVPAELAPLRTCPTTSRLVHFSEVRTRNRLKPVYPEAARGTNRPSVNCAVAICFDEGGNPVDVQSHRCDPDFSQAAAAAVGEWRLDPFLADGVPIPIRLSIALVFQEPPPRPPAAANAARAAPAVEAPVAPAAVPATVLPTAPSSSDSWRTIHWSEAAIRSRVLPQFPESARGLGKDRVDCRVRMFVNEKGVPERVEAETCEEPFLAAAVDAAMKWRFYPTKVNGVAARVQFLVMIRFVLE
jgi:outer membrane biosynthesis protein TonB